MMRYVPACTRLHLASSDIPAYGSFICAMMVYSLAKVGGEGAAACAETPSTRLDATSAAEARRALFIVEEGGVWSLREAGGGRHRTSGGTSVRAMVGDPPRYIDACATRSRIAMRGIASPVTQHCAHARCPALARPYLRWEESVRHSRERATKRKLGGEKSNPL
jgi:hypothetical protein